MILERYVVRQVFAPLVAICTVLIIIFAGYTAIRFLNDAVNGLLSGGTVIVLVALRVLIALEVMLPVTFYLAIVLALSHLYVDGEITGMEACGVSLWRVMTSLLLLALLLAMIVTGLAMYGRPWAYQKIYALQASARSEFDFAKVEAGRFYELGDDLVFFAEALEPAGSQARNVWVWEFGSGKREVTTAQNAYQINGPERGQKAIVFQNGYHYIFNLKTGSDRVLQFQKTVLPLKSGRTAPPEYRRKAASTAHLAQSLDSEDIAEFQWRFSTGLSTILMSLLAILLSRIAPRSGKYGKVTAAIVLFFVFYNLSLIAKTWVEKQVVGAMPGIWWVNVLHAALVLIFYGSCLRSGRVDDGIADFYLIVDDYHRAFDSRLLALLNRLLPPNVFYLEIPYSGKTLRAKYAVLTLEDFGEGVHRWFHSYIWGRFAQPSGLIYARNPETAAEIGEGLTRAVHTFVHRALPQAPEIFTIRELWSTGLRLSYRCELRSEHPATAARLFEAASEYYEAVTREALKAFDREVEALPGEEGRYRSRISCSERQLNSLAWRLRRVQGKGLSLLRLLKCLMTFEKGLDYVLWKVERHSGIRIEPSSALRRFAPLAACVTFWRLFKKRTFRSAS